MDVRLTDKNIKKCTEMDNKETDFSRIIREQKSTIYMVCYMFSKDKQEMDDLFQL